MAFEDGDVLDKSLASRMFTTTHDSPRSLKVDLGESDRALGVDGG